MIADQFMPASGDVGVLVHDAHDRHHFRAFRKMVQELARLVSRLEDGRGSNTAQLLTPAAADVLRQLAGGRAVSLDALRVGPHKPTTAQIRALATAGLVELAPPRDEFESPEIRLTVTGEFQLLLIDLPGLVRMARGSSGISVEQLEATSDTLRALRTSVERTGRPARGQ